MPNTRPGMIFENGICSACINFEKQKKTDWDKRWKLFEKKCEKYRGINGDGYDCAIAVSGGKDSHFQVHILKEKMKMNPVLFTVGNIDWTEIGRRNLENLSERFGCDIFQLNPNRKVTRILSKKSLKIIGQPSWYIDTLLYTLPVKLALKMGIKLLVYGEDVNYTYGGKFNVETPSALKQIDNGIVEPMWNKWLDGKEITKKDINFAKSPSIEECKKAKLDPIYLSYYLPWNSVHNYQVAKRLGFRHLSHEHKREGFLENYDQVDSLSTLINIHLKYLKFAHANATDVASRWIRYGLKTREEMIPIVEENDGILDQQVIDNFCGFVGINVKEFWNMLDKWHNPKFFKQDKDGVWHKKFRVGTGIIK
jgi:N-acetyl sugar amidotransferase